MMKYRNEMILQIFDSLIAILIVGPATAAHWRGAWGVMDHYHQYFPGKKSFCLGLFIHCIFAFFRGRFKTILAPKKLKQKGIICFLIRKIYQEFFSFSIIMTWRGGWMFLEEEVDQYFVGVSKAIGVGKKRILKRTTLNPSMTQHIPIPTYPNNPTPIKT
jgi:hypothetical protein